MKITVPNHGQVTLTDNNLIRSGGEGSVYEKNGLAYKIFFDKSHIIPEKKIMELSSLTLPNIIKPKSLIYENNVAVGYVMTYVVSKTPLAQIFTKPFKRRNNITNDQLIQLIYRMRETIEHCHKNDVLVVDCNEMNFLLKETTFDDVYFIDVDSYQTKSFPASAIVEKIRDYHTRSFNENSDWFSFGIISFQMLTGVHPYTGGHNINDIIERMKKNISVFNKDVRYPQVGEPLDSLPEVYKNWYRAVFEEGKRLPFPIGITQIITVKTVTFKKESGHFIFKEIFKATSDIVSYKHNSDKEIIVTIDGVYVNNTLHINIAPYSNIINTLINNYSISAILQSYKLSLYNIDEKKFIDTELKGYKVFEVDNTLYLWHGKNIGAIKFMEHYQDKIFISLNLLCEVLYQTTQILNNIVIQNLLGSYYVFLFQECTKVFQLKLEDLNDYRVIDGKYDNGVLMIIAEKKGKYYNFIYKINRDFSTIRLFYKEKDITNLFVNFTVIKQTSICAFINSKGNLVLFYNMLDNDFLKEIEDNSLEGYLLFNNGSKVVASKDNMLYEISMK